MIIDSHVNLHAPQFDDDRQAVIDRARSAGVALMVNISDRVSGFAKVRALADQPDIWCTVGTHPHEAKENPDLSADDLIALANDPRVVGIGETGLDFHYDLSPRDVQAKVFRAHIAAARATGLPLVVHTREADAAMADILEEEYAAGAFRMLMHCYTSGAELAARAAALGAWFSVSGIATFKAAQDVRDVIAGMPAERIIVETDCPYLAPVPYRGRRNEPAYVPHVLAKLAEIRGWSLAEAEQRTEGRLLRPVRQGPAPMSGVLEITVLGCGSSGGVPRADGNWGACDPADPRNARSRCSLLVRRRGEGAETTVIVDTSPDLRLQCVGAGVKRVDAVLLTHDHADQIHGLDDVRAFFLHQGAPIPVHTDEGTSGSLMSRFGYAFQSDALYPAICRHELIPPHGQAWTVEGPSGAVPVTTFDQDHGSVRSVGYRFGAVAYSSDVVDLDEQAFTALEGLDVWIVDALRWRPHPTHAHVDLALEWIARVKPRRAILTNMHIDLDYAALAAQLPAGVEPAFDGLVFEHQLGSDL